MTVVIQLGLFIEHASVLAVEGTRRRRRTRRRELMCGDPGRAERAGVTG